MVLPLVLGAVLLGKGKGVSTRGILSHFKARKGFVGATYSAVANDAIIDIVGTTFTAPFGIDLDKPLANVGIPLRYRDALNYLLLTGFKFKLDKNAAMGMLALIFLRGGLSLGGIQLGATPTGGLNA